MWGVADNTNQYWRMGQNALLFNEQYQPKSAYESFKQGIVDGKAAVKIGKHDLKSDNRQITVNLINNSIYLNTPIDSDRVDIYDISGKRIMSSPVKDNRINIENLSHGVYYLQIISSEQKAIKYQFSK